MEISHEVKPGTPQITLLHLAGRVDASNYLELINEAKVLFASGTSHLLVDLGACDFISSSGLFALHSVALLANDLTIRDPNDGWRALEATAGDDRDLKEKFKIANVQPNVLRTLDIAGFSSKFDVYPDLEEAMAAFE